MIFHINIFIFVCLNSVGSWDTSYNYEKQSKFGFDRAAARFDWKAYPEPLPSLSRAPYVRSPYRSVYQGTRSSGDRRVYNKRFKYKAKPIGHRLLCEAVFDCLISHMAIETNDNIPIILRGGAGYKSFSVVIRAHAGEDLSATVRAFCPAFKDKR